MFIIFLSLKNYEIHLSVASVFRLRLLYMIYNIEKKVLNNYNKQIFIFLIKSLLIQLFQNSVLTY